MRCKACNAVMSSEDMVRKYPADTEGNRDYSDLCGSCHEESVAVLFGNYVEPETDYGPLHFSHSLSELSGDW